VTPAAWLFVVLGPVPGAAPVEPTPPVEAPADPDPPPPEVAPAREPTARDARPTLVDPILKDAFARLGKAGLLDDREATLEELDAALAEGQDKYVRGDALGSAVALYEIVAHPRFEPFAETPEMSSATYHLGVALAAHGADWTAQAAFARVIARGPTDPYFTPALRRHVDIGLATKDYVHALAELDATLSSGGKTIDLKDEDLDEREYLAARAAQQTGRMSEALAGYDEVGEKSRFHTAGRYLQGVIYAQQGQFRKAEAAFCDVIGGKNQTVSAFWVDRRYFPVRDLAHLGLGRIAHEERRNAHAFYHDFNVPQDSEELPHALFEASWTMAEAGEYAIARDLVAELRERFPQAPQTTEARLLAALLQLYDCDFRTAEAEFARFIDALAPVGDHIDEIREDPEKLRALHRELVALRSGDRIEGELAVHRLLLSMMDEDPPYSRLPHHAEVLRREAGFAAALGGELDRLVAALKGKGTAVARDPEGDALDVLADAEQLERGVAGLDAQIRRAQEAGADPGTLGPMQKEADDLRARVRKLRKAANAELLAGPAIGTATTGDIQSLLREDRRRISRTRARSLALADDLDEQAAMVASSRLGALDRRIDDMLGEARMGRIDAVLGAKKKLEIEVRDMAAGRFPPELFGKLQIEGVVGDDEEFWPYEGEYWADEYEGYR
jgi:tetratricopeptide (TPR) repeat protein